MTPCKERGWKRGDVFKVVGGGGNRFYSVGDEVTLEMDDGSDCPYFLSPKHKHRISVNLDNIEKIGEKNKYARNVKGANIDVYDVLVAWEVKCPATAHAIKKLLMPGQRGHKDKLKDLQEATQAITRAIELLEE